MIITMITSCLHKKSEIIIKCPLRNSVWGIKIHLHITTSYELLQPLKQLIMTRDDDSTIETTHKYAYFRVRRSTISHLTGLFKRHRHDMPE